MTYVLTVTRKGVIPSRSRVFQFTEVYWLVKWAFEMSFCVFWKVLTFNSRREEQMARLKGEARPLSEEHSSKRPIYIQILQASLPWTWLKRCYSHPFWGMIRGGNELLFGMRPLAQVYRSVLLVLLNDVIIWYCDVTWHTPWIWSRDF